MHSHVSPHTAKMNDENIQFRLIAADGLSNGVAQCSDQLLQVVVHTAHLVDLVDQPVFSGVRRVKIH